MKKICSLLFSCFVFHSFLIAQCSEGFNQTFAILNFGSGNVYYNLQSASGNPTFEGINLGNFCPGATFLFEGGQNKVWKCNGADIWENDIWYRIYPTAGSGGSFNQVEMYYQSGNNNGCGGADQTWEASGSNINILSGLAAGKYYLEVYSTAYYQYCGNGTIYASNNGYNYRAVFTVDTVPNASATSNPPICAGQPLTLNGGPGGYSYSWAGPVSYNSSTQSPTVSSSATDAMAGTYTLTLTTDSGCHSNSAAVVSVQPSPTAQVGPNQTVYINTVAILGDTLPVGGTPPYTYLWSPVSDLSSTTISRPVASPLQNTTYTLLVTDSNGCTNTDSVKVFFNGKSDVFTEITYTAENMQFTSNGTQSFVEFDVFASDTPQGLLFSQGVIFLQYDTLIFGKSIVDSNKIVATMGLSVDSPYYNLTLADSTPNMLKISITHTPSPAALSNLSTNIMQQLCHLKVNISAFNISDVTAAYDSIAMAGLSKYQRSLNGVEFPYDIVRVSGLVGANTPNLTYVLTNVRADNPANPTQVIFDIMASAAYPVPLTDAYIYVLFNSSGLTFDPNNVTLASWIPADNASSVDYSTSMSDSGAASEFFITILKNEAFSSTDESVHSIGTTPELIATVALNIDSCSSLDGIALDVSSMNSALSDYYDPTNSSATSPYTQSYDGAYTPNTIDNNPACTTCPGTNIAYSLSDYYIAFDSTGPGADKGHLYFTVNINPTSTELTSAYFYNSVIYIDYNDTVFLNLLADPAFQFYGITLAPSFYNNGTNVTLGGSPGQLEITLDASSNPVPLNFNGGPVPLFNINMPFDDRNSCNAPANIFLDSLMISSVNYQPVHTNYTTATYSTPISFCGETVVNDVGLYFDYLCPSPFISGVTSGINPDTDPQCPTAGSMIPVQIHGAHFLNGYRWGRDSCINNNFSGYLKFINADRGDINDSNNLSALWVVKTRPVDIFEWTDTLITVLLPTADYYSARSLHQIAGGGPFEVITPAGDSSSGGDQIFIEYALQNERNSNQAPQAPYLTSTNTSPAINTPYTNFPMYTFEFDSLLANNDTAAPMVISVINNLRCELGPNIAFDGAYQTRYLTNAAGTANANDGINEIFFLPSSDPFWTDIPSNVLALTPISGYRQSCAIYSASSPNFNSDFPIMAGAEVITGIDIYIKSDKAYTYNTTYPVSGKIPFASVFGHELGHGMGLAHCNRDPLTGYTNWPLMYYLINPGDPSILYYSDPCVERAVLRLLNWPTNADNENFDNLMLSTYCDTNYVPAVQVLPIDPCPSPRPTVGGGCSVGGGWENVNTINETNGFNVTLYPNPNLGTATLAIEVDAYTDLQIQIFDIIGNLISEKQMSITGSIEIPINLEPVANGMYLINVNSKGGWQTVKMIKLN